jgi:hypothetical protein
MTWMSERQVLEEFQYQDSPGYKSDLRETNTASSLSGSPQPTEESRKVHNDFCFVEMYNSLYRYFLL